MHITGEMNCPNISLSGEESFTSHANSEESSVIVTDPKHYLNFYISGPPEAMEKLGKALLKAAAQ